ncbi:MAG: hypothetical protein ABI137_15975 [Antricoccus sp.]
MALSPRSRMWWAGAVDGEGADFEGVQITLDSGVGLGEFNFGGCDLVLLLAAVSGWDACWLATRARVLILGSL